MLSRKKGSREETQGMNDAVKHVIYTGPRKFKCFLKDVEDGRRCVRAWGRRCLISITGHILLVISAAVALTVESRA